MSDLSNPPKEPWSSRPCPICGKPATKKNAPFCSKRCSDLDLSRWLKGQYVIPGEDGAPTDSEDES